MIAFFQYRVSKGHVQNKQRVYFPYQAEPGDCIWLSNGPSIRIEERKTYQSIGELFEETLRRT